MKNGRYEENGHIFWYVNDQLHRKDGPAVENANGTKEWWINDQLPREDGPAYEGANGRREWYINNLLHREDGPALEVCDGRKKWYLRGVEFSEKEFNQWHMKQNLNKKLSATLESRPKEKKNKI